MKVETEIKQGTLTFGFCFLVIRLRLNPFHFYNSKWCVLSRLLGLELTWYNLIIKDKLGHLARYCPGLTFGINIVKPRI